MTFRRMSFCGIAAAALSACHFGLPYSTTTTPAALHPISSPPIQDGRGGFRGDFCSIMSDHGADLEHSRPCEEALLELNGEIPSPDAELPGPDAFKGFRLVGITGFMGDCVKRALPFGNASIHAKEAHGLEDAKWVVVEGQSSSADNAETIRDWLIENPPAPGQRQIFIGYSKGIADLLETLILFPEVIPPGSAIVAVAGAVSGSPIADRGELLYNRIGRLPSSGCRAGDKGGVRDMTRRVRLARLAEHPLPTNRSYYSVVAMAPDSLVSAALKAPKKVLNTLDARNDGQVIYSDALIPGSTLLGYVKADHWAVTLPLWEKYPLLRPMVEHNRYPRSVLLEAILMSATSER